MHVVGFPGCCTASVLTGFGQSSTAEIRFRPPVDDGDNWDPKGLVTYDQLKEWIEGRQENARRNGDAILFATTNSDQVIAERVLTELGWISTRPITKTAHADKTLRGWMKPLDEIVLDERPADDLDIDF